MQIAIPEFPEEDESVGEILAGFFGPNCIDLIESSVLNVLLTYLCGSSVSVLENAIVEKEDPASEMQFAKRLEAAKKKNDEPIPASHIDLWSVPGTESIHFIESDTACSGYARAVGIGSGSAQKLIDGKTQGMLPLFIQFEDVPTNFVHITIHISTSQVPNKLKPLMPIFSQNFFNTHIMCDGKQFLIEPGKYASAVKWIRTMMFYSIFDTQRLKASFTKALADIPASKRDGEAMASEVNAAIHIEKSSLDVAKHVLVRVVYLKRLKNLLKKEPEKVIGWFNTVRNSLFTFQSLRFLVAANLKTLPDPLPTWDTLSRSLTIAENMVEIHKPVSLLNDEGRNPGSVGAIIGPMATLESSYSVSTAQGLASVGGHHLASIMVAIGYLEAIEGPLWKAVRVGKSEDPPSFQGLDC
ncbi:hypothetical protein IL306_004898 [Fusarium sp. DS 682]|nr:hypothetical protein IL306_004898 [Fusarium sp. DS 682]